MIIITGVSRGIGKALALHFLNHGEVVLGIGRNNTIEKQKNYRFIACDLSKAEEVDALDLHLPQTDENILFIHNAGTLGEVDYHQKTTFNNTINVMQVNLHSGAQLLQKIENTVAQDSALTCVFISSGAGKSPIPGWAAYCASKAAVDMFCLTIAQEWKETNLKNWSIFALAPGVVDTQMQQEIRELPNSKFSAVDKFIEYKTTKSLYSLEIVAQKFDNFLIDNTKQTICSLRDY